MFWGDEVQTGSISDLGAFLNEVSSTQGNGHHAARSRGPKSGHLRTYAPHQYRYSITSSARANRVGGISKPSSLAVLRLIANSNLVGCSTGRSPGLAPLRTRSTSFAERR